mmetsp:Transcript_40291/g.78793  ORF Transcript_40291/g.78793 Transcript_40291/m.78793 type:complete len:204 (-) Transcript_40291:174-785(-)
MSHPSTNLHPPALFGILIPGRPLRTDFSPISTTQFTLRLTPADSPFSTYGAPPSLVSVTELVVTLLEPAIASLGPDDAVVLYWQAQGCDTYENLGSLSPTSPSGIFRTGWDSDKALGCSSITICASVEKAETAKNLGLDVKHVEDRLEIAKKIALNLFNFMQSFNTHSGGSGQFMTVPTNVLDRWMRRFEAKYKIDPNFFMKS